MTRLRHLHTTCERWLVVGALVLVASSATALPVAAQAAGEGSAEAMVAEPDPAMTDAELAQATDAAEPAVAPAAAPKPVPTAAPVQFGPTGC